MTVHKLTTEQLLSRLTHPGKKVRIVLDTDTFNEIDDQFAVTYALKSLEHMIVEALYAAPFYNNLSSGPADGMEKSYQEILRIRHILGRNDIPAYRGSTSYLTNTLQPVESEAARDLIDRAMSSDPSDPLYVVAIGAITNVASALLLEPHIADRIVLIWLGGHSFQWTDTREFNLYQDLHGARIVLDSGVAMVLVPCMGVASHLQTSLSEIRDYVKDASEIGNYLFETYENCAQDHFAYTRVIWDIAVIAWLINPDWCPSSVVHSPVISDDFQWSHDTSRHYIRYVSYIKRDPVFRDLFRKIANG